MDKDLCKNCTPKYLVPMSTLNLVIKHPNKALKKAEEIAVITKQINVKKANFTPVIVSRKEE